MESISSIDRDLSPEEMDILQKVGHLTGPLSKLMLVHTQLERVLFCLHGWFFL